MVEEESNDAGELITVIDKMDGFKRYTLVLPMELIFGALVVVLAYQGHTTEALSAVSGMLGTMIGYYFGTASVTKV